MTRQNNSPTPLDNTPSIRRQIAPDHARDSRYRCLVDAGRSIKKLEYAACFECVGIGTARTNVDTEFIRLRESLRTALTVPRRDEVQNRLGELISAWRQTLASESHAEELLGL